MSDSALTPLQSALGVEADELSTDEVVALLLERNAVLRAEADKFAVSLDAISSAVLRFAAGEYGTPAPEFTGNGHVDAIGLGLNMMADEILERNLELERARNDALAANSAKSAFLANMSHELRTPLNAIIGYAELVQEQLDDPVLTGDLTHILTSGRNLLGLISDVLDLSKVEAGHMTLSYARFDVADFCKELEAVIAPLASKNSNTFSVHRASELVTFNGDQIRLRQVVLNLLSNSCKFTSEGNIAMTIERTTGHRIEIKVADTGIGIPADKLSTVFEAFVQVNSEPHHGGTGLGLAISKRFVNMMNGDITVESTPGVGTEFRVILPGSVSV